MGPITAKILITGDFCPINRIEELTLNKDFRTVLDDFIDVFQGNDLNITDLECPLTNSKTTRKKIGPHQKAHPECINILKHLGINLALMANNHIMDYGADGVRETIDLCRSNQITTVGVGKSPEEAALPFTLNIRNKKIAVLNYADDEFISAPEGSFICNPINPVGAFYDITQSKQNNDYVIVIIHAGNEFYELPSPRTKQLYRYLVDLGADSVISHHTHAYSGFEIYKSKPIFYGLGNFIYDWPGKNNIGWNKGYVVRLILSDEIQYEIIPLKQGNIEPGVQHLSKEEVKEFETHINYLNSIISDDACLEKEFQKYVRSVTPMYDAYIEPYFGKYVTTLRNWGFFPKFMSPRKRLLLLNISRCESHRDVLIRMLSRYDRITK